MPKVRLETVVEPEKKEPRAPSSAAMAMKPSFMKSARLKPTMYAGFSVPSAASRSSATSTREPISAGTTPAALHRTQNPHRSNCRNTSRQRCRCPPWPGRAVVMSKRVGRVLALHDADISRRAPMTAAADREIGTRHELGSAVFYTTARGRCLQYGENQRHGEVVGLSP